MSGIVLSRLLARAACVAERLYVGGRTAPIELLDPIPQVADVDGEDDDGGGEEGHDGEVGVSRGGALLVKKIKRDNVDDQNNELGIIWN